MTTYNKENGRKNMRLAGYDYSRSGLYFLTIVAQNRLPLFGQIEHTSQSEPNKMILNDAGKMIENRYYEIENKYPDKRCHEMMVMPNHFHCIIENLESSARLPDAHSPAAHVGTSLRGRPESNRGRPENDNHRYGMHNQRYGTTIGDVMDWFKTMTTNAYIRGVKNNGWTRFNGKLWQRNYYDHIIRNHESYLKISNYIIQNPANS